MQKTEIKPKLLAVTEKVKRLAFDMPKYEIAKRLNITPKTLETRINCHTWTYEEKLIIDKLTTTA